MERTVSMTFTAKSVKDIESRSLFQLLHCYYSIFGQSLLFLIISFKYFKCAKTIPNTKYVKDTQTTTKKKHGLLK